MLAAAPILTDFAVFGHHLSDLAGNAAVSGALLGGNNKVEMGSGANSSHTVTGGGELTTAGSSSITGNAIFNGAVSLGSHAAVSGNVESGGAVSTAGNAKVGGSVNAAGGSFSLGNSATVNGNVNTSSTATLAGNAKILGDLVANGNVSIGTGALVGGTVTHPVGTTLSVSGSGTHGGEVFGSTVVTAESFTPVAFPAASSFSAGVTNTNTGSGQTTTLAPGAYGNLNLGGNNTLNLSSGVYIFNSIDIGSNLKLNLALAGGPIQIFVAGGFKIGGSALTTLSDGSAADVYVETHGTFDLANGGKFVGTIFAPQGSVVLKGNSELTGAAYANRVGSTGGIVEVGSGADVIFELADYFSADLGVTKSFVDSNGGDVQEGDELVFTIEVQNYGNFSAPGVAITDLLPAGLTFVSAAPSIGSYDDGSGVWSLGDLAMDQVATLNITATVAAGTAGSTITNTAAVTANGMADPDEPDGYRNSHSVSFTVAGDEAPPIEGVKDPGHAYVDVNNDQLFTAGLDIPIAAALLADGFFDTAVSEGAYTAVPGAGLVITGVGPFSSSTGSFMFVADGTLVLNTNVTTTRNGTTITLTSREGSVSLYDPIVSGRAGVTITAAGDIVATDGDVLTTTQNGARVVLNAGGDIDVTGSKLEGRADVILNAGGSITATGGSTLLTTTQNGASVSLSAGAFIDVRGATLDGRDGVQLTAETHIAAESGTTLRSTQNGGEVVLAAEFVDVSGSALFSRDGVHISSATTIEAGGTVFTATQNGSIVLLYAQGDINAAAGSFYGRAGVTLTSDAGDINTPNVFVSSDQNGGAIKIRALAGDVDVSGPDSDLSGRYLVEILAAGDIFGNDAKFNSDQNGGKIVLKAENIHVEGSRLIGRGGVDLEAVDSVFANSALFKTTQLGSQVKIKAGVLIDLTDALIESVLPELLDAPTILT